MLPRTPLFAIACLAAAAGCSDQPTPTAPARPTAVVTSLAPTYAVTVDAPDILDGFEGSNSNMARGINALGDVTGVSNLNGVQHVVSWSAGSTKLIDVGMGAALDNNTAGQIAGEFGVHAALWTPDGTGGYTRTNIGQQLPSAVWSTANAINNDGQVVGTYAAAASSGYENRCFLWTPDAPNATTGTAITLPNLGGRFCVANDINSAGYVVGASTNSKDETHGFVLPPSFGRLGKIRDLTPDGSLSYATSINESGRIAGQHVTETAANAAIWTPIGFGSYDLTDLGTFTGNESTALDINDDGFVVGYARRNATAEDDAFFWQNGEFTALPGVATITNAAALTAWNGKTVQVVGISLNAAPGAFTALRWTVTLTVPK